MVGVAVGVRGDCWRGLLRVMIGVRVVYLIGADYVGHGDVALVAPDRDAGLLFLGLEVLVGDNLVRGAVLGLHAELPDCVEVLGDHQRAPDDEAAVRAGVVVRHLDGVVGDVLAELLREGDRDVLERLLRPAGGGVFGVLSFKCVVQG